MNSQLEQMQRATLECTFCGCCQAVCPVYAKVGVDAAASRGRLFQLRTLAEGKLKETPALAESITRCTLCMACKTVCPASIKTTDLFLKFRKHVADKEPLSPIKRMAFTSLRYRAFFEFALRIGSFTQGLFFKKSELGNGYEARLPLPVAGLNKRRLIPRLAGVSLSRLAPEKSSPKGKVKARVAFFPGCMLNYVYPKAGLAVINSLVTNDVEVILPSPLSCCGTPFFTSGDFTSAAVLAKRNINILSGLGVDAVITACATCGTALSHEYGLVLEEDSLRGTWEEMSKKVYDFAAFLVKYGYSERFSQVKRKVTYHDPCHLVRGMGVAEQPRKLIKTIPGVEFIEMRDADRCCGCAGTFSVGHYDLATSINDDKIRNAATTEAELLITGCSACRMHILDGMSRNNVPMQVAHTAELLAEAYAGKQRYHG
ncbi:MAG: (Fe-S)-binding protein [Deltaproteobacteria bacterium]|jgi:glycolate oxidase iron-sulfur subunit|nr:(Fe-S)-binding protein [Deltaproteobacteria bacterium]